MRPADKILYWSYVELAQIKSVSDLRKSFETMRRILEKDGGYKYVFTLTWLADWARALGMKRSSLPISRSTMCEEVNAINTQVLDFMVLKKRPEELAKFVEVTRRNKFNPHDVAYWYCPAREFGGRLLK